MSHLAYLRTRDGLTVFLAPMSRAGGWQSHRAVRAHNHRVAGYVVTA